MENVMGLRHEKYRWRRECAVITCRNRTEAAPTLPRWTRPRGSDSILSEEAERLALQRKIEVRERQ